MHSSYKMPRPATYIKRNCVLGILSYIVTLCLTCMIFAGCTFSLVHASRRQCASRKRGTILVWPWLTLLSSRSYKLLMVSHPNVDFSACWNSLEPLGLEENKALIIFLSWNNIERNLINATQIYILALPGVMDKSAKISYGGIKWIKHPRLHFVLVICLILVQWIRTMTTMAGFNGG